MKRIATWFSNVFWHLLFFSGPVVLIGWMVLLAWLIPIYGEMSPQNATRQNLVYWFLIRDFKSLPENKCLSLVECYLKEFGRVSGTKPEFEFSDFVQQQIVAADTARRERIQKEWLVVKEPDKLLVIPVPLQERNAMLLAKTWFFDQMRLYEHADFNGKKEQLTAMVAEIKWWQRYNEDFLLASGIMPHSLSESFMELEAIFSRWIAESNPDDRRRITAFKRDVTAALIGDGISGVFGGILPNTSGNPSGDVTQKIQDAAQGISEGIGGLLNIFSGKGRGTMD